MHKEETIIYLDRNENQYGPAPACFNALKADNFKNLSEYSRDFRGVFKVYYPKGWPVILMFLKNVLPGYSRFPGTRK